MVEFNPDGSLKLPAFMAKARSENEERMRCQRCLKVRRELVSFTAPKKCLLHLTLSEALTDNRFVETIYNYFKDRASVPSKLRKIDEKHFEVEIGTDFRRCTGCLSLINEYGEFLDGNLIEEKGCCTFKVGNFDS
ncbi:Uncharacterised protein [uncultured archaeon]|nr:Uncharacterised protein [uncultured archaeon]